MLYNTGMKADIKILPEDKVHLTQDQKNLIELAVEKQLPVEDAEFLEKLQESSINSTKSFIEMNKYFILKYGADFGPILISAITNGEEGYKQTIKAIEESKAKERVERQSQN